MNDDRSQPFTAILLAGDRAGDPLAEFAPSKRKALLPLRGRPMLLYVLETLLASPEVGDIVIVANTVGDLRDNGIVQAFLETRGGGRVHFHEGSTGPAASVSKVAEALGLDGPVLVTTADNPLLKPGTLATFCAAARAGEVDVLAALARERDIRAIFPKAARTFLKLKGGGVSGCNLFALMNGTAVPAARAWSDVEDKRKKPLQLIAHFGVFTLLTALLGQLTLDDAMDAASHTLGLKVGLVVLDDPIAAMDVDRLDHVAIAEAVLAGAIGTPN